MADMEMYHKINERTHVGDEPVEDAPALEDIELAEPAEAAAPQKAAERTCFLIHIGHGRRKMLSFYNL